MKAVTAGCRRLMAVISWILFAWIVLATGANGALAADMAAAEALFTEGKRLFDDGKIDAACQKFAESQRIDPSAGTLLNLARCHEHQGKTATAWAEYLAAKRTAATSGRAELADAAAARAAALEPRLSHLTIRVAALVEGIRIARNGVVLEPAALGTELPVDPGTHRITASAPGYEHWSADVVVGEQGKQLLEIPPLAKTPEAPAALEPEPGPKGTSSSAPPATVDADPPILAYVIGGVGVLAMGTGLVFGGLAKSHYDDALAACPDRTGCSTDAISQRDDAETFATVANIAVPVGLAGVAAGVVLWALHPGAPDDARPSVRATAMWTAGGPTAGIEGRF